MVEMNARSASRLGLQVELREPLDALGRVGVEQVERQPARAHQDQPADPVGVLDGQPGRRTAAQAVAEQVHPLDAELVEQRDDVVRRRSGSSCRPPAACRSRRSPAGRRAGCGTTPRTAAGPSRSWTTRTRPGRRRAASPAAGRRRSRSGCRPGLVVVERESVASAFAERRTDSLSKASPSVHPGVDLVAELVGAEHLQRPLGVVGGVHPAGVGVAPGPLQRGCPRPARGRRRPRTASRSRRWRAGCRAPGRGGP